MNKKIKYTLLVILGYFLVCAVFQRFNHPEVTEWELIKNFGNAILWK